jgi:PAS domain S-box-containing protein
MSLGNLPYFTPYIASFLISFVIGGITWRRRKVSGAQIYALMAFTQCLISFGYMLELASPTLAGKIFWDDFQWLGFLLWAILFPIFSIQFTRSERTERTRTWILLSIVPALFLALLLTNPLHGLIHHDEWLIFGYPFDALRYEFTPVVWIFGLYGYILMGIAFANLLRTYFKSDPIYRAQVGAVVIGSGIPIGGTLLVLVGVTLSFQRDIAPITMAIGNVIVAWGLFRYHLFDIVPIAWDVVVQNMNDFVIVIDQLDRIVGLNPAVRKRFFGRQHNIIGKLAQEVFAPWVGEEDPFENQGDGKVELSVDLDGQSACFDVQIAPLRDWKGLVLGQVIVARDITRQKEMEQELRLLNTNLEGLVHERTRDLAEAYDSTLEGWAKALEFRDKETEGHSRRVTELMVRLAREVGFERDEIVHIRRGALIHDIGKMAIPDEILNKPGALTDQEMEYMKQHTVFAETLLAHISYLKRALEIPCSHHERWDGQGYPKGLKGLEIPLSARLFTLVDHWDALLSDRPYRNAWEPNQVVQYIQEQSGIIFDPDLVDIFLRVVAADQ